MDKPPAKPSREDRLAAKLRENLCRRKVQTRQQQPTLPKPPSKS